MPASGRTRPGPSGEGRPYLSPRQLSVPGTKGALLESRRMSRNRGNGREQQALACRRLLLRNNQALVLAEVRRRVVLAGVERGSSGGDSTRDYFETLFAVGARIVQLHRRRERLRRLLRSTAESSSETASPEPSG
jgi:hypothetical protein